MFDFGILSNNERNLHYIKKLNPKSSIRLANDKIATKAFLAQRGVAVPKNIAIIPSKKLLYTFRFDQIKATSFVIKPASGSKGNGIMLVKRVSDQEYKIGEEIVNEKFLIHHMLDILNGDFSLNYGFDTVLVEETLVPGNGFEIFCEHGLADIRVIVYNLVPVAAMIRMPTNISSGKANLAQGGIGLGIEVGTGIINTIKIGRKVYTSKFPEKYAHLEGMSIPFWDEILLSSASTQFFVNLGYLALDWVITKDGPKLLEINARAGLEIQNVCMLRLKQRLAKIKDLKVSSPEKGLELAKSLFSRAVAHRTETSKVLYLSQEAKVISEQLEINILLKIDVHNSKNFVSQNLYNELIRENFTIELDENIRFKNLKLHIDDSLDENTLVLGTSSIKDFLIKPEHHISKNEILLPKSIIRGELAILKTLDDKISRIDKKISLSRVLKSTNYLEQLDLFIQMQGQYNPIFTYDFPSSEKLKEWQDEIYTLRNTYFKKDLELKSKFAKLFSEKLEECDNRLALIKAYKYQNYSEIDEYNTRLFGKFDKELFEKSEKKVGLIQDYEGVLGPTIEPTEVAQKIKTYLEKHGIPPEVKVVLSIANMSRVSVNRKKGKTEIRVSADGVFRENEIDGIIAHEIGIHLTRFLNGKKSGWHIFESGTANYIIDEEGLAVYHSLEYYPEQYVKNAIYENYYMLKMAKSLNFKELADKAFHLKGNDYNKVFKMVTRCKKGICDTSVKKSGALYAKDKIYLDGYTKIKHWIHHGGDKASMMIGKIKIEDLDRL